MQLAAARRFRTFFPLVAACLLIGTPTATSFASMSDPAAAQLLVSFRPGARGADVSGALAGAGASEKSVIPGIGVHLVSTDNPGRALTALSNNPNVVFAEADSVLKPQEVLPNDPYFLNSGSWNLGGGAWGWYVTHTTQAWDITKGDPSVQIAILDTGIKPNGLADFGGRISSTWNVLTNTSDATSNAGDHGTYVAGVASLALGNGAGNAGYCPECGLMIVQVGTDTGATLANLAGGLVYAADHDARIANLSWAGSTDSPTLQSAINYAHSKGMVIFAAAGNSNCNCTTYPAADQNVVGVGGVANAAGDKQGDSNYGNWVDIAAPEGNMTAWPSINGAPGYAGVGGTSMASPAAAGIAGLLLSYNPSLSNSQLEQALEVSAAPVNFPIAYGRVDALAALQYLGASDPQPSSAPIQTASPEIYYEVNGWTSIAPLTSAPQVGQVLVRGIGGWTGSSGLAVAGLQWQRCDGSGSNCTYLTNRGTYTVQTADTGSVIKLIFSVQNPLGSVPVALLTQPVGGAPAPPPAPPAPPTNLALPTISGQAQEAQALTASPGTWSGSPTSYVYQWARCDTSGGSCAAISGASSSSYVIQTADVNSTLIVTVTVSNTGGSTTASSTPTATIASAPASSPTPAPTTQTLSFSGSLNPKNASKSFGLAVGTGKATAKLSFAKCNVLSIVLDDSKGLAIGNATGPSVVSLASDVTAGTYNYVVSGGRCSFTLVVTFTAP